MRMVFDHLEALTLHCDSNETKMNNIAQLLRDEDMSNYVRLE